MTSAAQPTKTPVSPSTNTAVPSPTQTTEPSSTPTDIPTETPTMIPLEAIDLEATLIQDGDLPPYMEPGQFSENHDVRMGRAFGEPVKITSRTLYNSDISGLNDSGWVSVLLYETEEEANQAYRVVSEHLIDFTSGAISANSPVDIGVEAYWGAYGMGLNVETDSHMLTYARCNGLVWIRLIDDYRVTSRLDYILESDIVAYAKRLDDRLTNLLCSSRD